VIAPPAADRLLPVPDLSAADREQVRDWFVRVQDAYFEHSLREAQAGAKIIVWPENNLPVFKDDEDPFLQRARGFAQEHAVFLLMGTATIDPGAAFPVNDHAVLIDPAGQIVYSYTKITAVPITDAHNIRGQGPIPVADTPYGRIASPICFDLDFPQLIQQVGQSKADIMLVPSDDPCKPMTRLHQQMAEFRAVENGVAMFRIAGEGWASAVDPYGRSLAAMDDLAAQDNVIVAQVPTQRVFTLYSIIGDLFAWLCVAGLLISIGTVIYRRVRVR
jgi:apolipoprotein N-acyltransferase